MRKLSRPYTAPTLLWTLYLMAATIHLLRALGSRAPGGTPSGRHKGPRPRLEGGGASGDPGGSDKNGQVRRREAEEKGEGRVRTTKK